MVLKIKFLIISNIHEYLFEKCISSNITGRVRVWSESEVRALGFVVVVPSFFSLGFSLGFEIPDVAGGGVERCSDPPPRSSSVRGSSPCLLAEVLEGAAAPARRRLSPPFYSSGFQLSSPRSIQSSTLSKNSRNL